MLLIHEDRPDHLVGVKLLVLSLDRHLPEFPKLVCCPNAPGSFFTWLATNTTAQCIDAPLGSAGGADIKPALLLYLLARGCDDVVWLDSDMIITSPIARDLITGATGHTVIVAQETYWGQEQQSTVRTLGWGLIPARKLPATANTCVVRVTPQHTTLLSAWKRCLEHPAYKRAQAMPWYQRPLHFLGDQEVFTALLESSEFVDVEVRMLVRGMEIAQCFGPSGYTVRERLASLARNALPPIVHAQGRKPYAPGQPGDLPGGVLSRHLIRASLELSPYSGAALQYRDLLGEACDWMLPTRPVSRLLSRISGNPVLRDMPLCILESLIRRARRRLGVARYSLDPATHLSRSPVEDLGN
jgi:hypothetical protein